jgi:hypothetical protein
MVCCSTNRRAPWRMRKEPLLATSFLTTSAQDASDGSIGLDVCIKIDDMTAIQHAVGLNASRLLSDGSSTIGQKMQNADGNIKMASSYILVPGV